MYCAISQDIPIICSEVVICIVFVCFNGGGGAHFWQRTPIPIENGNLSMPENLVMTSAYVLCLSIQTLRVGVKKLGRVENEVSDICVAVPFDEKLTILRTTNGSSIGGTGYSSFLGRILINVGRNKLTSLTS